MANQLLISLFETGASKDLSVMGMLKNNGYASLTDPDKKNFHTELASFMKNSSALNNQTSAITPLKLNRSRTEDIDHLKNLASFMGVMVNINSSQIRLNQTPGQDTSTETLAGPVTISRGDTTTTAHISVDTVPNNAVLKDQGSDAPKGTDINLTKVAQHTVKESAALLTDEINADRGNANTNKDSNQGQNPVQSGNSVKINQNGQAAASASSANNSASLNPDTLLNPKDSVPHNKVQEQPHDSASPVNSGINPPARQGSAQVNKDINKPSSIFTTSPELSKASVSQSSGILNPVSNDSANGAGIQETALQTDIPPDNFQGSSRGTGTLNEPDINPVNTIQNTKLEINFTSTVSQVGSTAKPLELLGSEITDTILQKAKLYIQGDKSEMRIQLSPPELGTIELEFNMENDTLEVKIMVERAMVKDIVEKDIPKLREFIAHSDINVDKLDVSLQEKEGGMRDFAGKDFQSGSRDNYTYTYPNQGNGYFEDKVNEESMVYDVDLNQINYFV
ncbi:MAG: flagellar hook-length control protein FliK [wastewater metagenome]|nr:flagellar hook-length control protein FliK [Candidatus Loosdrechtia aerotolerans]